MHSEHWFKRDPATHSYHAWDPAEERRSGGEMDEKSDDEREMEMRDK